MSKELEALEEVTELFDMRIGRESCTIKPNSLRAYGHRRNISSNLPLWKRQLMADVANKSKRKTV